MVTGSPQMRNFSSPTPLSIRGSVAAKFEVTAYSKLAPPKISNLCIFEYTNVYSNIHGHFVDDYRIWTPFDSRPVNSKLWVSANP